MHRICLFFIAILFSLSAESQSFNYSFRKDSVGWQELNNQTILNSNNAAWNFCYKIPIGFSFNYLGTSFDSIQIETNGYLVFGNNRNFSFVAFNGFGDQVDRNGTHAVLGYELSGTNGNRILKIQFKNVGQPNWAIKQMSYQIWLYELNSKIETRIGTNNYSSYFMSYQLTADSTGRVDSIPIVTADSVSIMIGLLNMNMNTSINGYLLGGSIENPQGQEVNENSPELSHLMVIPRSGFRYTFQPSN